MLSIGAAVRPADAQLRVGDLVDKDSLTRTLPPNEAHPEPRELLRATEGRLTTMTVRAGEDRRRAIIEHREVFVALFGRPGSGAGPFRSGVAAVREDSLYRVLYIAETELGYVERLEALSLPGSRAGTGMLHVRFAQTGSGGVTDDRLFALAPDNEFPIGEAALDELLEDGEYICCGRFTEFGPEAVELTVYVTRSGRPGITHRVRVRYELEGRFRFDEPSGAYVPDFRLVPGQQLQYSHNMTFRGPAQLYVEWGG